MMAVFDKTIIGEKFGRLTVLDEYEKGRNGTYWKCKCECGNETFVYRGKLTTGHTTSCGCKTAKYNGLSSHPLHYVWSGIKDRCTNTNNPSYQHYGGRGIRLCPEWQDFLKFYEWATNNGYVQGLSIDRIDNDGDYSPDNCQFLTVGENTAKANRVLVRRKSTYTYWGISPDGTSYTFSNAADFSRKHNLNGNCLRRVASGERPHYKNWKFGYTTELNI